MFFGSKDKKAFQEGSRLIKQKKWEEALQILEPLQGSSDIDPIDLTAAINQARDGYFQQRIGSIETSISRKQFFVAIQQLNSLAEKYPDNERISNLLSDVEEKYYEQKIAEAQNFLRQKKFDEAESLLVALDENFHQRKSTEQFLAEVRLKKEEQRLKSKRRKKLTNRVMLGLFVASVALVMIGNNANANRRNQQAAAATQTRIAYFAQATEITWTPTATQTSTNTPTPTFTATETHTVTATHTASATYTATMTHTPTATHTASPSPTTTATNTSTNTPLPTRTPTSTPVQASVTGNGINARSCPAQNCQVLEVLDSNETFQIVGVYDDWYGVKLSSGITTYISSALVTVGITPIK